MVTLNKKECLALKHLGLQRHAWKTGEDQEHYEEGNDRPEGMQNEEDGRLTISVCFPDFTFWNQSQSNTVERQDLQR